MNFFILSDNAAGTSDDDDDDAVSDDASVTGCSDFPDDDCKPFEPEEGDPKKTKPNNTTKPIINEAT